MLEDDDALEVLNHLRSHLVNAGFGDFDAFAYSLISDEFTRNDQRHPLAPALLRYLEVVQNLLKRVGTTQIDEAKQKLSQALELDGGIEIEVDLSEIRSLMGNSLPSFLPLQGSSFADNLSYEFSELYIEIENFQYPGPTPSPSI